ncbi:MAG: hypothetical protein PHR35_22930 [Kiritimatiellae bacterium]|nr:hypothetical protein [Kiritimatiellia bacterium]
MTLRPFPLPFTAEDAEKADDISVFNCGPGALCAVLGINIPQFWSLPSSKEYEQKGYTNPTLMKQLLFQARDAGHLARWTMTCDGADRRDLQWPAFGLARIQWGGPWCLPTVSPKARYRQTHWVAAYREHSNPGPLSGLHVFDINAVYQTPTVLGIPGWIRLEEWARLLVPELLKGYPRNDGSWWITHAIEVTR